MQIHLIDLGQTQWLRASDPADIILKDAKHKYDLFKTDNVLTCTLQEINFKVKFTRDLKFASKRWFEIALSHMYYIIGTHSRTRSFTTWIHCARPALMSLDGCRSWPVFI